MGYALHLRNFRLPGVVQGKITPDQISYFSVLELDFRVRLGRFFRQKVSTKPQIEIACLNRIHLPKVGAYSAERLPKVRDRHLSYTRICVIENQFKVSEEEFEKIRSARPFPLSTTARVALLHAPGPQLLAFPRHEYSLPVIRNFLTHYFEACPPEFQGDRIRSIWLDDFYTFGIVFGVCLHQPNEKLPNSFVRALMLSENPRRDEIDMSTSFWNDAPREEKTKLRQALRRGGQPSFLSQLLLMTHQFQTQHNQEMAVLTAVASLEASMFQFAEKRFGPGLSKEKGLLDEFLRVEGASVLVKVIPRLFFAQENVPDNDVFKNVARAVSARNKIMHGKGDSAGNSLNLKLGHLGSAIFACRQLALAFQREADLDKRP